MIYESSDIKGDGNTDIINGKCYLCRVIQYVHLLPQNILIVFMAILAIKQGRFRGC